MGKSVWDYIAPIAGSALAIGLGQPELLGLTGGSGLLGTAGTAALGAGIGSGTATGAETGNPLAGLASGVGSGVGSYAGGQILGPVLGGVGGAANSASGAAEPGFLGSAISKSLGDTALSGVGNALGSTTGGDVIGGAVGGAVGQGAAENMLPGAFKPNTQDPSPYAPSRADAMTMPGSLSSFGNLDPNQQATNIATKGVYGGGEGSQENQYFLNLINRQLVDQTGNVGDQNTLPGIDKSYLSQLGLGGFGNTNDLLKGISQYQG